MNKPRKHAELIKTWADGAEIEFRWESNKEWRSVSNPHWEDECEYRIKPAPKPDMVFYGQLDEPVRGALILDSCFTREYDVDDKLKLTFDGSTGELKSVEML